jgi:hypothetical protein
MAGNYVRYFERHVECATNLTPATLTLPATSQA